MLLASALVIGGLAAAGARFPGASLARAIAAKIVCALELDDTCAHAPELVAEYGLELARTVRDHAPHVAYENGMRALPVDYRRCREDPCSLGPESGAVLRSSTGEPVVAFVHAVDCRPGAARRTEARGSDCSGSRAGSLYLQYWFYYPGSATGEGTLVNEQIREISTAAGHPTYHPDDWESYHVRVGDGGADARASSHHGYNYGLSAANWSSDMGFEPGRHAAEAVGLRERRGWGPETGWLYVAGGSHAGHAHESDGQRLRHGYKRLTPAGGLTLIPIEPIAEGEGRSATFAVTPPWLKTVYRDPEFEGT